MVKVRDCKTCGETKSLDKFERQRAVCTACRSKARRVRDSLKADDFDVSVANDGKIDPRAAAEKRQEFSLQMAENLEAHRSRIYTVDTAIHHANTAEAERRYANRRLARTVSISDAHEALWLRNFREVAETYFADKITPTGYARKKPKATSRALCLLLSDLHIGAELSEWDNPTPFGAIQEARRLEWILRQVLDYKTQYRAKTELHLLLNGDLIDGDLMHDRRDGAPVTEQMAAFYRYFQAFIAHCAAEFPKVTVTCQPGNHGRDKLRHPGRATSSKWDGHEWRMYDALRLMSNGLKNVQFNLGFRAVSVVPILGSNLLLTHGDTEIKLKNPNHHESNYDSVLRYTRAHVDQPIHAVALGHFHSPCIRPGRPAFVYNGMLVPSNGYARTEGYKSDACGQYLWEAVEGFPVGDSRYIQVGPEQDNDESLGSLIEPFRFPIL